MQFVGDVEWCDSAERRLLVRLADSLSAFDGKIA